MSQTYSIPFPNKPLFLRVCSTSLLKTLWEKKKLLVTSNFSFSRSVFYPFRELFANSIKFEIVSLNIFYCQNKIQIFHDTNKEREANGLSRKWVEPQVQKRRLKLSSAKSSSLEEFKICRLGKGYITLRIKDGIYGKLWSYEHFGNTM